jgi:hypothetical protein
MKKMVPFFTLCMLWGSLPIVFGLEYWEHLLPVSNYSHLFIQVLILGIILKWVWFWNQRLVELEIEKVNRLMSKPKDFIVKKSGQ